MTTTDQPTGALTRRQLREIRMTGQTPVLPASDAEPAPAAPVPPRRDATPTPLPRAAEPVVPAFSPPAEASSEAEPAPRTRRQARAQEQTRTASVTVTPATEVPAAASAAATADAVEAPPATSEVIESVPAEAASAVADAPDSDAPAADALVPGSAADTAIEDSDAAAAQGSEADAAPVLRPEFGAAVLHGDESAAEPRSFDELITHDTDNSGTTSAGNTLIVTDTGSLVPLTAPVASTGETLVTGTYNLPEGLGSRGHAPGVADGKEVDAVLIDGELPPQSSPTPIAASAAVSQAKAPGEIIKPPVPEKSNKLMLILAITAGALALALVVTVIIVTTSGAL